MPNVYREKQCPRCGVLHRKRRLFCSRECGNIREFTEEQKQEISQKIIKKNQEYHQTPAGAAHRQIMSHARKTGIDPAKAEDFAIEIPDIPDKYSAPIDLGNYDDATDW